MRTRLFPLVAGVVAGCGRSVTPLPDVPTPRDAAGDVAVIDSRDASTDRVPASDAGIADDAATDSDIDDSMTERTVAAECRGATRIEPGTTLVGESVDGGAPGPTEPDPALHCFDQYNFHSTPRPPLRYYAVGIPPRQRLSVRLTPDSDASSVQTFLTAMAECDPRSCVQYGNRVLVAGDPFAIENPRSVPLDVTLVVATSAGTYDLATSLEPLPPAESSPACATATARALNAAQLVKGFVLDDGDPDRVYTLHLDASAAVQFFDTGTDPVVRTAVCVRRTCDGPPIVCSDVHPYWESRYRVRSRVVLEPGDYAVTIDLGAHIASPRAYALFLTTAPAPAFTHCATAPPLVPGSPVSTNSDLGALPPDHADPTGIARQFYAVTIPPGQHAVLSARGVNDEYPVDVSVLEGCDATTAIATRRAETDGNNDPAQPPAHLRLGNRGTAPRTVIAVLASETAATDGTAMLSLSLSDPMTAASCATPAVPDALGRMSGNLLGAMPSASFDYSTEPGALYYAVTVPAGATLALEGNETWNAGRFTVFAGCGGATLATASDYYEHVAAAAWTNRAATDAPVIVELTTTDVDHAGTIYAQSTLSP